jgi:hypothetical protein
VLLNYHMSCGIELERLSSMWLLDGELGEAVGLEGGGWANYFELSSSIGFMSDPSCLQCAPGYSGQNCSKELDACQSQPCHNHGTCSPKPGGFHCACPPGFVGLRCEGDVDECLDQPCHPTGTAACHSLANAFYCQCLPGHTGEAWDRGPGISGAHLSRPQRPRQSLPMRQPSPLVYAPPQRRCP